MTELLLNYLRWPGAAVLVVLVVVLLLRKPLSEAIHRGGLKIGKDGLRIDQAASAAASAQSDARSIEDSLVLDPEAAQRRSHVTQAAVPAVVREQQSRIRSELNSLKLLDNKDETINLLTQHLAVAQLILAAERTYRIIFGGQIAILKHLNVHGPSDKKILRVYYDVARENFPAVLSEYPYESYLIFLNNRGLIDSSDTVHYTITPAGKEFLQWMAFEGVSEGKPA